MCIVCMFNIAGWRPSNRKVQWRPWRGKMKNISWLSQQGKCIPMPLCRPPCKM